MNRISAMFKNVRYLNRINSVRLVTSDAQNIFGGGGTTSGVSINSARLIQYNIISEISFKITVTTSIAKNSTLEVVVGIVSMSSAIYRIGDGVTAIGYGYCLDKSTSAVSVNVYMDENYKVKVKIINSGTGAVSSLSIAGSLFYPSNIIYWG